MKEIDKKKLDREASEIHKSTRTIIKKLEPVHFKCREKYYWYYCWHKSSISVFVHWFILLFCLAGIFYLGTITTKTVETNEHYPEKQLLIAGPKLGSNVSANILEKNNLINEKSKIKLDNAEQSIGVLKVDMDLGQKVSWKNITWDADLPQNSSIVYRSRISNDNNEESWEKISWSDYYPVSGSNITTLSGIPKVKSQCIQVEIVLQGNSKVSPSLNYFKFGYTPFNENKTLVFLRDKFMGWLSKIFKFLEKREETKNYY